MPAKRLTREEASSRRIRVGRSAGPRVRAEEGQVVGAPNTDAVLGDIIDKASTEIRPMRGGDYLHVSDLIHRCIRKKAIEAAYKLTPSTQRLTMSDLVTFAQGDAIHDTLKERARIGAPHMVWGMWSCKCEYLKHTEPCVYADTDTEETCKHCNTKVDRYHEVPFFDDEYGVVGNPDLILWLPRKEAYHITELKSIAHDQWNELSRPKPEHVQQVVMYWHLAHRKGMRLTDRVSIFYQTKGWLFGSKRGYKEYLIDPQEELHRLEPLLDDAKAFKAWKTNGELPPRTYCSHPDSKDAKACGAASSICWSM